MPTHLGPKVRYFRTKLTFFILKKNLLSNQVPRISDSLTAIGKSIDGISLRKATLSINIRSSNLNYP